ncbi:UBX domain-containing protein 7-like [Physella acuta]|uniref:UBX domain-containing protein 7-like n=1 Tax=Physella acuta TaxID=109671 RepID=UPI0027DBC196|nr:UBX domain-containing protein 7-like [Physella acuta]
MATPGSLTMNSELVDQFMAVTGAARNIAINLLEACSGNLDLAVGMHIDSGGAGPSNRDRDDGLHAVSDERDDVRAPIPQRTEVLVEEDTSKIANWRMRRPRRQAPSVFDGFRDFQSEAYHYDETLKGKKASKKRNLEDLYRPPVDITYKGTFQNVRDAGSVQNKWLLVNVQNVQEFPCQLLNRDVWSNTEARNIIKENFLFWQVYNDSEEGKRFMQFYKLKQWPHVAVIDPFTGESQVVWNKISDGTVFCEIAKDFLASCPVPDTSIASPPIKRSKREPSIVDASEQEQMEAAIKASLCEIPRPPSSPQYILDSDSELDNDSDSDDVIMSTPPGSSNGHSSSKHERLKQLSPSATNNLSYAQPEKFEALKVTGPADKLQDSHRPLQVDTSHEDPWDILGGSSRQQAAQGVSVSENSWKKYWGHPSDPPSRIMMRFPENKKEQIELPSSSQLKALTELCNAKGFPSDKYELVTNFPRRKLSQMDSTTTLKDAGLFPQETVFVQDL